VKAPAAVLVADPPWRFKDTLPGKGRGAAKHYPTMTAKDLERFPLPPLADDALLCFWRVAAMQQEALDIIEAWGFTLKSELVWQKTTSGGRLHFGMGRIVRAAHEVCLLATRGRFKVADRAVRSTFDAPVGRHSAKPDRFYRIVERLSPGPYAELFARRPRAGWSCYGNEIEGGEMHDDPRAAAQSLLVGVA
jgi:N6-adenosine-specific RNA methylase IME4